MKGLISKKNRFCIHKHERECLKASYASMYQKVSNTGSELKDKLNFNNKINNMLQTNSSLKTAGEARTSIFDIYFIFIMSIP